jgi:hypothetical protein
MRITAGYAILMMLILAAALFSCDLKIGTAMTSAAPEASLMGFESLEAVASHHQAGELDVLYDVSYAGSLRYIVSSSDLGIKTKAQFDASAATEVSATVAADDRLYDDYFTIESLAQGTLYYIYLLDEESGEVRVLSQTTGMNKGITTQSGSIPENSTPDYTIYFPNGYDASPSKTWPFLLTMKGGTYIVGNNDFPCIVFKIDVDGAMETLSPDTGRIRDKVKTIIEDPSYRIDKDRLYIAGFSAGGCAALMIANNDGSSQYQFKAVVGIGVSEWLKDAYFCSNLGSVSIWLLYGEDDTSWGSQTVTAFNGIKSNTPNRTADLRLSMMPKTGHEASPAWDSAQVFKWLLSK